MHVIVVSWRILGSRKKWSLYHAVQQYYGSLTPIKSHSFLNALRLISQRQASFLLFYCSCTCIHLKTGYPASRCQLQHVLKQPGLPISLKTSNNFWHYTTPDHKFQIIRFCQKVILYVGWQVNRVICLGSK